VELLGAPRGPWSTLNARAMRFLFPVFAVVTALGCGAPSPRAVSAVEGLPEYSPEETSIFGDILAPPVFGLASEVPGERDPKLADRTHHADAVVRVRVATVSEQLLAGTQGFTIVLAVETPPILGIPPENPLELQLSRGSPSFAMVQAQGSALVGRRFILFLRHYSHRGERVVHWHGEGDTPAFEEAIHRAKALDGFSTKPHTRD
jgi:hypothetical protein